MDESNESCVYGEPKIIGKVCSGVVHFLTLVDGHIPFVLIYQEGNTEYSPDRYEVLCGDSYVNSFDECCEVLVTPDGKSVYYAIISDEKYYLYMNDKQITGPAEKINNLEISDDSKDYAYCLKRDGLWEIHLNNLKFKDSFDSHSDLIFLPDGSLEFLAEKDGILHYYSTKKGELPNAFEKVGFLFRSPVSDKIGFFCAKQMSGVWNVYINEKEILGPFDSMGLPMTLSPSYKNYAFTAVRGNNWYVYVNNKKINRDFGTIDFLAFLPNNEDIVCTEVKDDGTRLYINEKLIAGPFEKLGFEVAFSSDLKRVYYSRKKGKRWAIGHTDIDDVNMKFVKDINITIPCSEVFNILVSPDLSRIMYSVILEKKNFFSEDSIAYLADLGTFGEFESIFFFKMSKDGSVVAFTAKEGDDWYLYVNGKKVSGPFFAIPNILFYKDTTVIKYKAVISRSDTSPVFMIYMDGKNYTGLIDEHKIIYMDGDNIVLRESISEEK